MSDRALRQERARRRVERGDRHAVLRLAEAVERGEVRRDVVIAAAELGHSVARSWAKVSGNGRVRDVDPYASILLLDSTLKHSAMILACFEHVKESLRFRFPPQWLDDVHDNVSASLSHDVPWSIPWTRSTIEGKNGPHLHERFQAIARAVHESWPNPPEGRVAYACNHPAGSVLLLTMICRDHEAFRIDFQSQRAFLVRKCAEAAALLATNTPLNLYDVGQGDSVAVIPTFGDDAIRLRDDFVGQADVNESNGQIGVSLRHAGRSVRPPTECFAVTPGLVRSSGVALAMAKALLPDFRDVGSRW